MNSTSENPMLGDVINAPDASLIRLVTHHGSRFRRLIEDAATQSGRAYFHWHPDAGVTRHTRKRRSTSQAMPLAHFLLQMEDVILDAIFIVEDGDLEEASIASFVESFAQRLQGTPSTLVLLSQTPMNLPESLMSSPCLTPDQDRAEIEATLVPLRNRLIGQQVMTVALDKEDRARLQESLQNATNTKANQVYRSQHQGPKTWEALAGALAPRAKAVQQASCLEYFSPAKCQLGLPGFRRLRQEVGLDDTWLVDGTAGCGRSLIPFVAAEALGCGLIRFDGAALVSQGNTQGSEAIRKALDQLAHSMAPVVVWFDQIQDPRWNELCPEEWLHFAKDARCLIIGTTRHCSPEQATRWSQAFAQRWWVDLPEPDQRRDVLAFHFQKRGIACSEEALERLAHQSAGQSSGQIEADILKITQICLDQEQGFQPALLETLWKEQTDRRRPSQAPPGWRSAHAESREVPLLPFTVMA